ncbi:acetyl-CoA C-acetyltransferase [uncultured Pseudokineococcus sp.]|uniref:acetyl-CoA C-acetyltransferase n=1 Tax=uncultured Pseudokineococcus sp. TaxID=1642928 RepID=UPI00262A3957|nr:acetyl-CoA C-acetyltransferase [uncultured Pseudokineococcus sp.]
MSAPGRVSVVVAGARTPMGRLQGALSSLRAVDLGAVAIRAALERAGVAASEVDQVLMGQVLQAGQGQNPARQAAAAAGVPMSVPALTVNAVCLSGLRAVALADQLVRAGEADVVVAGGMESMSGAPHLLPGARGGYRFGDAVVQDATSHDGLWDAFTDVSMGALTEVEEAARAADASGTARGASTREEQDALAARSHRLAAAATADGRAAEEITPVLVPQRRGEPVEVVADEGVRPGTTPEALAALPPAFRPDGTITAGSASPVSDGAAALVVMRRERAEAAGLPWLAEVGAHGLVAGPDSTLQSQPARAVERACARAGLAPRDLDVLEINEAFAAVVLASVRELGVDLDRVNPRGGAIALGHPIGASGARLALTLALDLRARGGGTGVAALCGGGGQGEALLLHAPTR